MMRPMSRALLTMTILPALLMATGCTFDPGARGPGGGPGTPTDGRGGRGTGVPAGGGGSFGGAIPPLMPGDIGSYGLGDPVTGSTTAGGGIVAGSTGCNTVVGVVRDFKGKNE